MRGITSLLAARASRTRASWLLLCLLMAATPTLMAGTVDDPMPSAMPRPPTLGAHTMLNQSDGEGSTPAVTSAVNTQEAGSSLLVLVDWHSSPLRALHTGENPAQITGH